MDKKSVFMHTCAGLCIKTHFDRLRAKCFDTIFGSGAKLVMSQMKSGSKIGNDRSSYL